MKVNSSEVGHVHQKLGERIQNVGEKSLTDL